MPYRIKIDRVLCTGYAECVGIASEVFQLDNDNMPIVLDPEGTDDEAILDAAGACPWMQSRFDEFEDQVWPQ
jgi:ferredoxin